MRIIGLLSSESVFNPEFHSSIQRPISLSNLQRAFEVISHVSDYSILCVYATDDSESILNECIQACVGRLELSYEDGSTVIRDRNTGSRIIITRAGHNLEVCGGALCVLTDECVDVEYSYNVFEIFGYEMHIKTIDKSDRAKINIMNCELKWGNHKTVQSAAIAYYTNLYYTDSDVDDFIDECLEKERVKC